MLSRWPLKLLIAGSAALCSPVLATAAGAMEPAPGSTAEAAQPADDPALEAQLQASANRFMANWRKHDMAALSNDLAPDFLFVGARGIRDRARTLDALDHCDLTAYELGDFQMRRLSAQTVVLIYKVRHDMICRGHKVVDETLNTDAFVRRGGSWRIVVTTETPLQAS